MRKKYSGINLSLKQALYEYKAYLAGNSFITK